MFKNPFSFNGRIRRLEYGLSHLIYIGVLLIVELLFQLAIQNRSMVSLLLIIIYIPLIWFMFAQGAKRCHDRGNSGWFQLIPFYGLWMLFADGMHGRNEYGDNPKGIGNFDEIDAIGVKLQ